MEQNIKAAIDILDALTPTGKLSHEDWLRLRVLNAASLYLTCEAAYRTARRLNANTFPEGA